MHSEIKVTMGPRLEDICVVRAGFARPGFATASGLPDSRPDERKGSCRDRYHCTCQQAPHEGNRGGRGTQRALQAAPSEQCSARCSPRITVDPPELG